MSAPGPGNGPHHAPLSRSQARLAAVQALYQMDLAETDLADVIEEFKAHRLGRDAENGTAAQADPEHFSRVLQGVVASQREIDPLIDRQLAQGWRLERIDSIVRAILLLSS
jgi:transcription antitermination protein NusB